MLLLSLFVFGGGGWYLASFFVLSLHFFGFGFGARCVLLLCVYWIVLFVVVGGGGGGA